MPALPEPPVRALVVLNTLDRGGAERLNIDLARRLRVNGISCDFLLIYGPGAMDAEASADGARVLYARHQARAGRWSVFTTLPLALLALLRIGRRFDLLVAGLEGPPSWLCTLAGRLLGVPVVLQAHNDLEVLFDTWGRPRAIRRLNRLVYPRANACIAVSERAARTVTDLGAPRDRVHWVSNGIDTERVRRLAAEPLPDDAPPRDLPWVVAVGRLVHDKGFDMLLEAHAAALPQHPHRLVVCGVGPDHDALLASADDLGVAGTVHLVGVVPNPFAFVSRARLFCLSSRVEGQPLVLLEALSLGIPVLATRCGSGTVEALGDGSRGSLCDPTSEALSSSLAEALGAAPVNPSRVDEARLHVEAHHGITRAATAYAQVMRAALTEARLPRVPRRGAYPRRRHG